MPQHVSQMPSPLPKVLVVDDEAALREYLALGLPYEGFAVQTAADAEQARQVIAAWAPEVILLDILLPGENGYSLAREWVNRPGRVLIFLTARDAVDDRVRGLDLGADDYLVKPFAFKELVARIRRHLRRLRADPDQVLVFGPLSLDPERHRVRCREEPVALSPREFDLLACLMRHPGQVLSKSTLLDWVWGYTAALDGNLVEVYIRSLRDKLQDRDRRLIQTVRGVGYRLGD